MVLKTSYCFEGHLTHTNFVDMRLIGLRYVDGNCIQSTYLHSSQLRDKLRIGLHLVVEFVAVNMSRTSEIALNDRLIPTSTLPQESSFGAQLRRLGMLTCDDNL